MVIIYIHYIEQRVGVSANTSWWGMYGVEDMKIALITKELNNCSRLTNNYYQSFPFGVND